jgi:thioredoxin-related protein
MTFLRLNFLTAVLVLLASHKVSSASKDTVITIADVKGKTGIQFIEQDWAQALKTAKDKGRLIFLDIYATWCGPCKMLKQYTFTDSSVGEFFNKNFVNVSVDGEKGVGPELAQQYAIEGYPTLIVADETGKPVLITAGYIPSDVLMQFANEALKRNGRKPNS